MKQIANLFKRAALAALVVAGAVMLAAPYNASALGPESIGPYYSVTPFYTTNSLSGSNLIAGYPTNTIGTAWANTANGQGVPIITSGNLVTLIMEGYLTNAATTNIISLSFVTSGIQNLSGALVGNPAVYTTNYIAPGASATSITNFPQDWSWNSNTITIGLPAYTGFYHYETNLVIGSNGIPSSGFLGISSINWNAATATTFSSVSALSNAPPGVTNGLGLFFLGQKVQPIHLQ